MGYDPIPGYFDEGSDSAAAFDLLNKVRDFR
jgi:hypothetical protein